MNKTERYDAVLRIGTGRNRMRRFSPAGLLSRLRPVRVLRPCEKGRHMYIFGCYAAKCRDARGINRKEPFMKKNP